VGEEEITDDRRWEVFEVRNPSSPGRRPSPKPSTFISSIFPFFRSRKHPLRDTREFSVE
jgi:hypothetical protein